MSERPIIFSAWSIRAILAGRKTQTRRVVRNWCQLQRCRYGEPSDLLWVKEAWRVGAWNEDTGQIAVDYRADGYLRREWLQVETDEQFQRLWEQSSLDAEAAGMQCDADGKYDWEPGLDVTRWRSPLFMPKCATRIWLRIADVRAVRLCDISASDCRAEGATSREDFAAKWDAVNKKRGCGWETNPWVWAITFERIERGTSA